MDQGKIVAWPGGTTARRLTRGGYPYKLVERACCQAFPETQGVDGVVDAAGMQQNDKEVLQECRREVKGAFGVCHD